MYVHGEFHQYPLPRPQPSLESHFSNWEIVFVFDNQPRPPFPCCVVTPPTEMTRKGWEASSSCRRKNRSQLLAVRAPGANWQLLSREGLLWDQPGYCWLPSAWLDSPLNPLTNVSAGPIHLKLLDSKISPIHIQSPKDHLPSLISSCPKNQTSYTKT